MSTTDRIAVLNAVVESAIKAVALHPVTFDLRWKEPTLEEDETVEDVMHTQLWKDCKRDGWAAIVLPKTRLCVFSNETGNHDERGGGCGDWKFPVEDFKWEVHNPRGITLQNLVEGVYRMKGSKYDHWYEMFASLELTAETEDGYTVRADFDYGS